MSSKVVLEHTLVRQKICVLPYAIAILDDRQQVSSFKKNKYHFMKLLEWNCCIT